MAGQVPAAEWRRLRVHDVKEGDAVKDDIRAEARVVKTIKPEQGGALTFTYADGSEQYHIIQDNVFVLRAGE